MYTIHIPMQVFSLVYLRFILNVYLLNYSKQIILNRLLHCIHFKKVILKLNFKL